jgi:hypothetical protein
MFAVQSLAGIAVLDKLADSAPQPFSWPVEVGLVGIETPLWTTKTPFAAIEAPLTATNVPFVLAKATSTPANATAATPKTPLTPAPRAAPHQVSARWHARPTHNPPMNTDSCAPAVDANG